MRLPQWRAVSAAVVVLAAAAGIAAAAAALAYFGARLDTTVTVKIAPGSVSYRASGEYLRDGVPMNAPLLSIAFDRGLTIMERQVSATEYERCVAAGACKPTPTRETSGDVALPVVGVDWNDATAYAAWLTKVTGEHYRLPTDAEWAYAAGERFRDDAIAVDGDPRDPAQRWLSAYESESALANKLGSALRPFGSFGAHRNGMIDIAGNIWEWTNSCYVRHAVHAGARQTAVENCGVRVVEGSHRTYMSDFIRNPRGGACSVGAPPSNLGFRLVKDEDPTMLIAPFARIGRRSGLWLW